MKILIADDDHTLRGLICDILKKQGYDTIDVADGTQVIEAFSMHPDIDLLILDVMMPGLSGFEVLEEIRGFSEVPVLMLTALGDEINEVNGLQIGANDYVAKPFSYPVFIARVGSLMRKAKKTQNTSTIIGNIELNRSAHKVLLKGEEIKLNNKEYRLLELLISNNGIALNRFTILDKIWGYDYDGDDKTINTHIKTLRSKLGIYGAYIKTIKGTGYMFEACELEDMNEPSK